MPNLVTLLTERFQERKAKVEKMNELAERSHQGKLSSFSGVFQMPEVTEDDKSEIQEILSSHSHEKQETGEDFEHLLAITSEIKAINNQAIMLHGERIQRAQKILKRYKDGAFTKWLLTTYGNRQTPYNFLQYYEFYSELDEPLKRVADDIPKQVIYSLSSRKGSQDEKKQFLEKYNGENKQTLLKRLRDTFPLKKEDKRHGNCTSQALQTLKRLEESFSDDHFLPTLAEKKAMKRMLDGLRAKLHD